MALGQMLLFPLEEAKEGLGFQVSGFRSEAEQAPPTSTGLAKIELEGLASSRTAPTPTKPTLDQLRAQVERIQSRSRSHDSETEPCFSAGGAVLNAMLPHGGLRRGTIVQWVGDASGNGAATLASIAAAEIAGSELSGGKPLVIFNFSLDGGQDFYPPAAIALGVPANRMVIVNQRSGQNHADMIWAIDQALRCDAVAAVWAEIGPWLNDRDARRLQLAAEAGNSLGLFVRPAAVRGRPSFADISWHVSTHCPLSPGTPGERVGVSGKEFSAFSFQFSEKPLSAEHRVEGTANRRLRVQVDRCRGGVEGAVAMIEISSSANTGRVIEIKPQTGSKHESTMVSDLAHRLAHPTTTPRRSQRDTKRAS